MRVISQQLTSSLEHLPESSAPNDNVDLVLVHGNSYSMEQPSLLENLCQAYPCACIAGISAAGELLNGEAFENSIVYSAIEFDHTTVRQARVNLNEDREDEYESGLKLAKQLLEDDLAAVIIYSEGLSVDCDEIVKGARQVIDSEVPFIGGLASDVNAIEHTVVMDREGVYDDAVVALGIYGKRIEVDVITSNFDQKGIEVEITSSEGNIIYEINGKPALSEYENLILEQSSQKLNSRLLHPLLILDEESNQAMYCRSIHAFDTESNSLLSAGTVPEGRARLISVIDLKDLIRDADSISSNFNNQPTEFALVVSCAGRKTAMDDEWPQEATVIQKNLGETPSIGFYSFGEIGMSYLDSSTILHNHTLTIAAFTEK